METRQEQLLRKTRLFVGEQLHNINMLNLELERKEEQLNVLRTDFISEIQKLNKDQRKSHQIFQEILLVEEQIDSVNFQKQQAIDNIDAQTTRSCELADQLMSSSLPKKQMQKLQKNLTKYREEKSQKELIDQMSNYNMSWK